jgi:ATP-dependent Clp protease ATP-binding subunit ClpX
LITEAVAQRKEAPIYLARGQQHKFRALIAAEEEEWQARGKDSSTTYHAGTSTFEEYREKSKAAGVM